MTSIKSLFNLGIYKNILKRFKWGGFLYFIVLFLSGPFIILNDTYIGEYSKPEILTNGCMMIPTLLTMIVPTIVAVLCFRDVHSSKQGIFSHSLPITRLENYITTVFAGLTLMFVPVILIAVIYGIMGITAYGNIIPLWSVFLWMFVNFAVLFIMFAFASFTAFLTGHTAAHIAINALLHVTPLVIALGIALVSEIFLFGFTESDSFIASVMAENTPFVWLFVNSMEISEELFKFFFNWNTIVYVILAIALYSLAFLLYKNRKIEACGDVAAFKSFRPILKYTATFFAAILIFGMISFSSLPALSVFTTAIIVTAVVYFASEMLIKKTFKVFKSYKGYLGFVLFMAVSISTFAFTDIFGYEHRIPEIKDIESVSIYTNYSYKEPYISDIDFIQDVQDIHKEIISDIPVTDTPYEITDDYIDTKDTLIIKYHLTNGKKVERLYHVSSDVSKKALSKIYGYNEYKHKVYGFNTLNIENAYMLSLRANARNYNYNGTVINDKARQLLEAVKLDIEQLSYSEIVNNNYCLNISFRLSEYYEDNQTRKVFDESVYKDYDKQYNTHYSFSINVNPNFKNTFNLLKEFGYFDYIVSDFAKDLYICKIPVYIENNKIKMKDDIGKPYEFLVNHEDCIKLSDADAPILANNLASEPSTRFNYQYNENGTYYIVFWNVNGTNQYFEDHSAIFAEEDLPDYLFKYISKK